MKHAVFALLLLMSASVAHEAEAAMASPEKKCTDQARATFKASVWAKSPLSKFSDHYNPIINQCFLFIESTQTIGDDTSVFKTLINVTQSKQYGMWAKLGEGDDAPVRCTVTMPSGDEEPCGNETQFRMLIKRYMQQ